MHLSLVTNSTAPGENGAVALDASVKTSGPDFIVKRGIAKSTPVFDTYWRFAVERQRVFFARIAGASMPWTTDPVLQQFKFTNAYRASDRVSQYLIRHVIYSGPQSPQELFFRIILFKLFNRIETWELLVRECGDVSWSSYSFARYDRILGEAMSRGERIYSAAYIMAASNKPGAVKHQMHLRILEQMMHDHIPDRLQNARTMADAFVLLRSCPMIGDFLAYQYLIDLNYSPLLSFSEMDFIMPGPGAKDGIRKCFGDLDGRSEADIIRFVADEQDGEFTKRNLTFQSLWGRSLQLIDCQNLFCEVDKYARVAHPEISGLSGRTKIKQHFEPDFSRIDYWYPPKWGLNLGVSAAK
jgi:hypothetical protein